MKKLFTLLLLASSVAQAQNANTQTMSSQFHWDMKMLMASYQSYYSSDNAQKLMALEFCEDNFIDFSNIAYRKTQLGAPPKYDDVDNIKIRVGNNKIYTLAQLKEQHVHIKYQLIDNSFDVLTDDENLLKQLIPQIKKYFPDTKVVQSTDFQQDSSSNSIMTLYKVMFVSTNKWGDKDYEEVFSLLDRAKEKSLSCVNQYSDYQSNANDLMFVKNFKQLESKFTPYKNELNHTGVLEQKNLMHLPNVEIFRNIALRTDYSNKDYQIQQTESGYDIAWSLADFYQVIHYQTILINTPDIVAQTSKEINERYEEVKVEINQLRK